MTAIKVSIIGSVANCGTQLLMLRLNQLRSPTGAFRLRVMLGISAASAAHIPVLAHIVMSQQEEDGEGGA